MRDAEDFVSLSLWPNGAEENWQELGLRIEMMYFLQENQWY